MISHLKGTLASLDEESVVMDVAGVGYHVSVPSRFIAKARLDQSGFLYIYHHFREDFQALFGFETIEERRVFEQLIGVSGVGPKVGMKVLSAYDPSEIAQAIVGENAAVLTAVSGVGKKVAERIIIELKDKFVKMGLGQAVSGGRQVASVQADLMLALKALGYGQDEIRHAFHKAAPVPSFGSVEEGIKYLLRFLS